MRRIETIALAAFLTACGSTSPTSGIPERECITVGSNPALAEAINQLGGDASELEARDTIDGSEVDLTGNNVFANHAEVLVCKP